MIKRLDDNECEYTSAQALMRDFYGDTWWYTKRATKDHAYYNMLLASMVESGDVMQHNGYRAAPKAFQTLYDYELEERRHKETILQQKSIVRLTWVLAFVGMMQVMVAAWPYIKSIVGSVARN